MNFPQLERALKKEQKKKIWALYLSFDPSKSKCVSFIVVDASLWSWVTKCWTNVRKQCLPFFPFYFVCSFSPCIYVKPYLDHWRCTLQNTFYSEILIIVILKSLSEDRLWTYFVYTEKKSWIWVGTKQFCDESQVFPDLPPYRQYGVKISLITYAGRCILIDCCCQVELKLVLPSEFLEALIHLVKIYCMLLKFMGVCGGGLGIFFFPLCLVPSFSLYAHWF